ncbi:MAG: tetratricopeptide repeat protein [Deltaproteobacteria bacterium]|nr:tetratricopeptide repeat protein [Deltaproteobacteria bacterium]
MCPRRVRRSDSRTKAARLSSADRAGRLFDAEAAYAESIVRHSMGDSQACADALRRCVQIKPDYAPGLLALGSVEIQLGRKAEGLRLLMSLLDLPDDTEDLVEIVDQAGQFLIDFDDHETGLELYRLAAARFPGQAVFFQGVCCCASDVGDHAGAVKAARAAVELEPGDQKLVNDLGWSLFLAGRIEEAEVELQKAVGMDPEDELAHENLKVCEKEIGRRRTTRRGHRSR